MPHSRFYLDDPLTKNTSITLKDTEHHHLAKVMRLALGETAEIINGKNILARAKIESIEKRETHLTITSNESFPPRPGPTLAIAYLKPSSLELAIEKCTELGASSFHLFPAELSDKKSLSENNLRRLHTLLISATKQCGRLDLPSLALYPSLQDLPLPENATFGDLTSTAPPKNTTYFISGPESGFTPSELSHLHAHATGISLGPNTLRAETAPIALTAHQIIS